MQTKEKVTEIDQIVCSCCSPSYNSHRTCFGLMSVYRLRRWPTPSQLRLDEMCLLSRKRQIIQYVRRIIRERGFIDTCHNMVVYQVILKGVKQKQIKLIFKIILYCSCFTDYQISHIHCLIVVTLIHPLFSLY